MFPVFREYYLKEYKADEFDLLPSAISFAFIEYHNKLIKLKDDDEVEKIISFLLSMHSSSDENLQMLHNEFVSTLSGYENLNEAINQHIKIGFIDISSELQVSEMREKVRQKKMTLDQEGERYLDDNRSLLKKYTDIG